MELEKDQEIIAAVKKAIIGAIEETRLYEVQRAVTEAVNEQLQADGWIVDLVTEITTQLKENRDQLISEVVEASLKDTVTTIAQASTKVHQLIQEKIGELKSIY